MAIDSKIEAPTRKLLGPAIRGELDDLYKLIADIGPPTYEDVSALTVKAAGYISVRAAGRWPNGADIKALAKHAATAPSDSNAPASLPE